MPASVWALLLMMVLSVVTGFRALGILADKVRASFKVEMGDEIQKNSVNPSSPLALLSWFLMPIQAVTRSVSSIFRQVRDIDGGISIHGRATIAVMCNLCISAGNFQFCKVPYLLGSAFMQTCNGIKAPMAILAICSALGLGTVQASHSVPEIYSASVANVDTDSTSAYFDFNKSGWFVVEIDHESHGDWDVYDVSDTGIGRTYRTKYCWAGLYNDPASKKYPAWIDARLLPDISEYHGPDPYWDDYYYTLGRPSPGYEYYVVKMVNRKDSRKWVEIWLWVDGSQETWEGFVYDSDGRFYVIPVYTWWQD